MRLNRINLDREEEEENEDNDIKEEKEEEEDEVEDEEKGQKKEEIEEVEVEGEGEGERERERDGEGEGEGEREGEENEEEEDVQEENEYDDSHNGKMMGKSAYQKERPKRGLKIPNLKNIQNIKSNKPLLKRIICIIIILVSFLIIVNIIIAIVKKIRNKNTNGINEQLKLINNLDKEKFEKIKNYLFEQYNSNGEVNLNKFQVESIEQKEYNTKDTGLTSIHISTSLSENRIQDVIIHLSSAIQHMSSASFLHIHIMNTDNFTLETFSKLMGMVHKINNNTEIIIYNAQQSKSDFKMRDDKADSFKKEYARLYALKAVKNTPKLIMLNIDNIMVEKDLSELFEMDLNDIYVRGVPEAPGLRYKVDWMDNYLFDKSDYINGDVILVNLEFCQREDFYNKAMELNNNDFYSKVEDPVQDIINVIMRKKITFLNLKYNKYNFYENSDDKNDETKWYPCAAESIKYGEKSNHFYTKEELLAADSDPFIINYVWDIQTNKKPKKYEEEKETYAKLNGFI